MSISKHAAQLAPPLLMRHSLQAKHTAVTMQAHETHSCSGHATLVT
jgi:hypothetical protein